MALEQPPLSIDAHRLGVSQDHWREMDELFDQAFEKEIAFLSPRQREVFSRTMHPVRDSQTQESVAAELGISRRTVRTHIQRSLEKFRRRGSVIKLS